MNVVAPVLSYIDALVHVSARDNPISAARHRNFIGVRLIGGLAAFAILPLYLVQRGTLTILELVLFGWFLAPIAIAYFLSRTGRFETAQILSSLSSTILIAAIGVSLEGVSAAMAVWLILVPLEAALAGSRRAVLAATAFSLIATGIVLMFGGAAAMPMAKGFGTFVNIAGIAAAIGYAVVLAFHTQSFTRTSSDLLLREGERYRLLASNMTDVITRHGVTGSVQFASAAAQRVFRAPLHDLLGQGILDRVHVADRPAYLSALDEAARDAGEASVEFRIRREVSSSEARAGQQFFWMEMRCRRINDSSADGVQRGEVVAVMRDVTERKHHEALAAAARREAEKANEAKGRFLAMMSHELRTPLNAVIGFSEMLHNEEAMRLDIEKRREYSRLICESGHHLLSVVNLVLDMSKIESGSFVLSPEVCAIGPLVRSTCDLLALKAHESGLDLSVRVDETIPDVTADKRAVRQMLINLLSNAIKFTPANGRIEVVVAMGRDGELILAVSDTGVGIAEADLPHVGSPFYQAGGDYDRRYEGTGLGLSIVKGLIELHGGRLAVESRVGAGTTVKLFLPIDAQAREKIVELKGREAIPPLVPTEPAYEEPRMHKRA